MIGLDILNFLLKYIPIVGLYFTLMLNVAVSIYIITAYKEYEEIKEKEKQLTYKYSNYEEQRSKRHTEKRKHRRQVIRIQKNK